MILIDFDGKIEGTSDVTDHEKWIPVDSFQLGVGRSITISGTDRDTSTPSFSEVTFTRGTDKSSPYLFMQAIKGCAGDFPTLTVRWLQVSKEGLQNYLIYEFTDPIVSSYSLSSGGERPSESFSVNFTKISMTYNHFSGSEVEEGEAQEHNLLVVDE